MEAAGSSMYIDVRREGVIVHPIVLSALATLLRYKVVRKFINTFERSNIMSKENFDNFVIDHETLVQLAEACKAYRKLCGRAGNWYAIQDMGCVNQPYRAWYLCIMEDTGVFGTMDECLNADKDPNWLGTKEEIVTLSVFAGPWASAEDCYYAAVKAEWLVAADSDTVEHVS
jgi:hypothetical protein